MQDKMECDWFKPKHTIITGPDNETKRESRLHKLK